MATDTSKYKLNHSMLRIKDPERSIKYYEYLGMSLIKKIPQPDAKFDLYFLAYDSPSSLSHEAHWSDRQGILELTHNYGTEHSDSFSIANGNGDPGRGFGHICISVDNIQAACQRIEDAGYKFQKKLSDGRMRHIAFALDPDNYWVEIISNNKAEETEHIKETDPATYRMNHTMIRVKDHAQSLQFYQDVLGMSLLRTNENPSANFNLYFLGYVPGANNDVNTNPLEGVLELTWNYNDKGENLDVEYHNGNTEPQGFGHIAITVDDLDAACKRFEEKGVRWKKRLTDGRMKNVAFVLDPDGYWIEVVQNERLKARSNW
ncbi:MAG: hypothetical protein Q9170_003679 [Blastenia crenularia]